MGQSKIWRHKVSSEIMVRFLILSCCFAHISCMSLEFNKMFELGPVSLSGVEPKAEFHHEMAGLMDVHRLLSKLQLVRAGDAFIYSRGGLGLPVIADDHMPTPAFDMASDNAYLQRYLSTDAVSPEENYSTAAVITPTADSGYSAYNYDYHSDKTMFTQSDYDYAYYH